MNSEETAAARKTIVNAWTPILAELCKMYPKLSYMDLVLSIGAPIVTGFSELPSATLATPFLCLALWALPDEKEFQEALTKVRPLVTKVLKEKSRCDKTTASEALSDPGVLLEVGATVLAGKKLEVRKSG